MKLTVYSITTEFDNCGTETQVFGNEKDFYAALSTIMQEQIEARGSELSDTQLLAIQAIEDNLQVGEIEDIEQAWKLMRDYDGEGGTLLGADDSVWTETHHVEIPAVAALVQAAFAVEREHAPDLATAGDTLKALHAAAVAIAVPE